jgi:catechol 2,3-dioxygenase-like lactoylglutathione lyase family enzyme
MSSQSVTERIRAQAPATGIPFAITKIGHVVLNCSDLERSVKFYTQVLGFKISDVYEEEMVPGGMVFMRFGTDHHGVGLVGAMPGSAKNIELHHLAFEVATLDELLRVREHVEKNNVTVDFHGRRRAGAQIAVEFEDPDGHQIEIFWGLDKVGSDGAIRPRSEWRPVQSLEDAIDNPVSGQDTTVNDKSLLRR